MERLSQRSKPNLRNCPTRKENRRRTKGKRSTGFRGGEQSQRSTESSVFVFWNFAISLVSDCVLFL